MRRLSIAVITAVLSGCTTEPIADTQTSPIPRDRVLAPQYLEAAPNTGVVAVKRDPGFMAGGCKFEVLVDAQPVAQLKTSERVVLHLPIGDHNLGVRPVCPMGSRGVWESQAHVTATAPLSYRVGATGSGDLFINPTSF